MKQLSCTDAAFVHFDNPRTPMIIGGVYIFEGKKADGNFFTYQNFVDHAKDRIHLVPVLWQRLLPVPFGLDHPYWVADPEFDIERHILHMGLIAPQNKKALWKIANDTFSRPLDYSRPLWEATFIEGLDNVEGVPPGSIAIIFKIHHCAVDGVSAEKILAALLDISPVTPEMNKSEPLDDERVPTNIELLAKSLLPLMKAPFMFSKLVHSGAVYFRQAVQSRLKDKTTSPPFLFNCPPTILDLKVTPHRVFAGINFSLDRIKTIKNQFEGYTVNDVVLAICSGAVRSFLLNRNKLPDKPLVTCAPLSTRTDDSLRGLGNRISFILTSLATDEQDPAKRLKLIHDTTRQARDYNFALKGEHLMDIMPSLFVASAGRLVARYHLFLKNHPIFNVVTTNVPGPQIPLYMDGAKLLSQTATAPIIEGMGLMMVITSYSGTVTIGVTSCREIMPDTDEFLHYLDSSFEELESAVLKDNRSMRAYPRIQAPAFH